MPAGLIARDKRVNWLALGFGGGQNWKEVAGEQRW
jgi:hypothetical protein